MAEIVWTGPAILDLQEIADYIALDDPDAGRSLVAKVEQHVSQLERHPRSGSFIPEAPRSAARQLIERPCRIFYRIRGERVYILHVQRSERLFRASMIDDIE